MSTESLSGGAHRGATDLVGDDCLSQLLEGVETAHIVELAAEGYRVRHPLIERLDGTLTDCNLDGVIRDNGQPHPDDYGLYRMTPLEDLWAYERMDG